MRVLVIAALLAAAGCDQIGGAKTAAPAAETGQAAVALACEEGLYELMAATPDMPSSRTEPRQRAARTCSCMSGILTPADYAFVEGLVSTQVPVWRLEREQTQSGRNWEGFDMAAEARALVRLLESRGLDDFANAVRSSEQQLAASADARTLYSLRLAGWFSSLTPPITDFDTFYGRTSDISHALGNSCQISIEESAVIFD